MSAKVISLSRKKSLRNLQPRSLGRKPLKRKRWERLLDPNEVAAMQAAVSQREDPVTPVGISEMRQAIEDSWLLRKPQNTSEALAVGIERGRNAALADMAKILHEAARLCARK